MASYNIEMNMLNEENNYDKIYPYILNNLICEKGSRIGDGQETFTFSTTFSEYPRRKYPIFLMYNKENATSFNTLVSLESSENNNHYNFPVTCYTYWHLWIFNQTTTSSVTTLRNTNSKTVKQDFSYEEWNGNMVYSIKPQENSTEDDKAEAIISMNEANKRYYYLIIFRI